MGEHIIIVHGFSELSEKILFCVVPIDRHGSSKICDVRAGGNLVHAVLTDAVCHNTGAEGLSLGVIDSRNIERVIQLLRSNARYVGPIRAIFP